jgi:hypothetical protein
MYFIGLGRLSLFQDEAYYWVWSYHIQPLRVQLELSFFDHPFMLAYVMRLSTFLFGESEFGVRALFASVGVSNVYLVYRLASFLYDRNIGLLSSFLLATNPGYVFFSRFATSDILAIAIYTTTILAFSIAMRQQDLKRRRNYLLLTGILLGLGLDTKYTLATSFLAIGLFVIILRQYLRIILSKDGFRMLLLATLAFLPVIIWNIQHRFASFVYQSFHAGGLFAGLNVPSERGLIGYVLGSFLYYPIIWAIVFTIPIAILLFVGTIYGLKQRGLSENILLSFFVALVIPFSLSPGKMAHWTMPALVVMSILSARMILALRRRILAGRRRVMNLIHGTVFVILIILFSVTGLNTALAMSTVSLSDREPKSPLTYSLIPSFNSSRWLVNDLNPIITHIKPRVVLAPNWVTASEVMFYFPELRGKTYVFQFDYQLGIVWKTDVKYAPEHLLNGSLVVIYTSLKNVSNAMLYSSLVSNERGDSLYQRTGLDTFTILKMPTVHVSHSENGKRIETSSNPYAILVATYSGSSQIKIIVPGGPTSVFPKN